MSATVATSSYDSDYTLVPQPVVSAASPGVSWGAVFAGAASAAALSLILLVLGVGLGLSSVSPWASEGVSAATFGIGSIVWLTFTTLAASAIGGYLAGRLRAKWASIHTDEVYFRDTAHGFLAWAAATLATAALLTSTIGSILGTGVQTAGAVAGGVATTAVAAGAGAAAAASDTSKPATSDASPSVYFIDSLFRRDIAATPSGTAVTLPTAQESAASAAEVGRIFVNAIRTGALPADDQRYVGQLVAQRTGLAQADAEKRVGETFARLQTRLKEIETQARDAADKARKASAYAALWMFIALLGGAFVASLSATFGGRRRDL